MSNIIKGKKIFSPQVGGSSISWGGITGTLALQLDLQAALDAKASNTLTISTTAPLAGGGDLSANRTLSITQSNGSTDGYLSAANWTTFNGKQNTITLTTTGTSGAATFVSNTLNVPQYAAGLTYFTEAQNTAAPNATVYVDSLTAVSTTTNADFAIIPKGTGALLTAIPDNAITGGNKRGTYAVDLQLQRNGAARISSGANSSIVGGYNNGAYSQYSIAGGSSCEAMNTNAISLGANSSSSGVGSLSIGSSNASSGTNSTAIGATCNASGNYSVAIGQNNTASGANSTAIGVANNAVGAQAVALGYQNSSSGRGSTAMGSFGASFNVYERVTMSTFGYVFGDSQKSVFILSARTTGVTATTMTASFSQLPTPAANNQVTLQNNNTFRFKGTIVARQSGSTNTCAWDIDGIIQRGTTAASTTLLISNVTLVQNTPAWGTPTLAADTTLGCLRVQVIGVAATNIQWTCSIDTTEVIYA